MPDAADSILGVYTKVSVSRLGDSDHALSLPFLLRTRTTD
jgi:hypothetical protein